MAVFKKASTSPFEQIILLKNKGLIIADEVQALADLNAISFFRLIPYMRSLQYYKDGSRYFRDNTSFEQLIRLYDFDRQLRLLVNNAIERIEVAIRAQLTNVLCELYGSHWYLERVYFKTDYQHDRLLQTIHDKQKTALKEYVRECARIDHLTTSDVNHKSVLKNKRKQENYARHYALTYDTPALMPAWAMIEELSLGDLSHLYTGLAKDKDKKRIAQNFDLNSPLLGSWLHTITVIRNICAHHARLWNRELGIKPAYPIKKELCWPQYLAKHDQHTRLSMVLAVLQHMMSVIHPKTTWDNLIFALFDNFQEIHVEDMGLPINWREDGFWK